MPSKKQGKKNPLKKSTSAYVPQVVGNQQAKEFLKKDHHDSNMVVAVRVRPLTSREL